MNPARRAVQVYLLFVCLVLLIGLVSARVCARPPVGNWNEIQLARLDSKRQGAFSFAVLADSQSHFPIFAYHLHQIEQAGDLDFIVNVGDLVAPAERGEFDRFFSLVAEQVQRPLLTAKGNHDISADNLYEQFCGAPYYSFGYRGSYFIVLDDANLTGLGEDQWRWLEKELQASQAYKSRLVFMHVPPVDPRDPQVEPNDHGLPAQEGRRLIALFRNYHVSHVFSGHIHSYYTGYWDGVPFTISGGGGARLVGADPRHSFHHFLRVTVADDGQVSVVPQSLPWAGLPLVGPHLARNWSKVIGYFHLEGVEVGLTLVVAFLALKLFLPLVGHPSVCLSKERHCEN